MNFDLSTVMIRMKTTMDEMGADTASEQITSTFMNEDLGVGVRLTVGIEMFGVMEQQDEGCGDDCCKTKEKAKSKSKRK